MYSPNYDYLEMNKVKLNLDYSDKKPITTPSEYDISNGMVGMGRHVWCLLCRRVGKDSKVRKLVDMCEEAYLWTKHPFFRLIKTYIPRLMTIPSTKVWKIEGKTVSINSKGFASQVRRTFFLDKGIESGIWRLTLQFSKGFDPISNKTIIGIASYNEIKRKNFYNKMPVLHGNELWHAHFNRFSMRPQIDSETLVTLEIDTNSNRLVFYSSKKNEPEKKKAGGKKSSIQVLPGYGGYKYRKSVKETPIHLGFSIEGENMSVTIVSMICVSKPVKPELNTKFAQILLD